MAIGGTSDIDWMLRQSGVPIALGPDDTEVVYGVVDRNTQEMLADGTLAHVAGTVTQVTLRRDAFSTLAEGSLLSFNGGVHRVLQVRKRDDGKVVHAFVAYQEPDLTSAQVEALIAQYLSTNGDAVVDSYLSRRSMLLNPLSTTPTPIWVSAGQVATTANGSTHIATSTPGPNKLAEYVLLGFNTDESYELRAGHVTGFKRRMGCFVGPYYQAAGNPTATMYSGIEIGSLDQFPPFPSDPVVPVAQLRIVGTPDGTVEFMTAKGDGSPAVVRTYNLAPLSPHGLVLEMEVDPFANTIKAYADNVLLGTSAPADFPDFGSGGPGVHFGIFQTTGTHAAASPETWFSMPFFRLLYA